MSSSIENIVKALGAKRFGDHNAQIDWILTDSRSLCFPEETLFFALKTKRNDGHKYIPDLYERGVRNFVVSELPENKEAYTAANFLQLANPLKGLQKLAEKHREQFLIPVVGITGSNGKTVVKEWLYQLLSPDRVVTRSPRSYNSQIGVPLSVWLMNEETQLAIFEAGISEMGEMEALQSIIRPTIGILTNIGGAHQENFFSVQEKCMEKLTLFKDCDVIIYDGDNELISSCVSKSLFTSREIAWSKKDNERPLFIESICKGEDSTTVKYRYLGMPNEYKIPFIDDASIENSLHCLAVALYMMVPAEDIAERMAHLEQIAMRLEVKEGKNGCVIINDSYNSDLASLDIALDFMSRRSEDKGKKRTLILSDTPVLMGRVEFGLLGHYNKYKKSPFETFDVGGDGMTGYSSYATESIALRGYENSSLTPYGSEGYAYTRLGLELRYPLMLETSTSIYALTFVEAGNAWHDVNKFNPFELKRSAGVGVRIFLPMIGMMGIDWAYGFDKIMGSSQYGGSQFHFILGQEF